MGNAQEGASNVVRAGELLEEIAEGIANISDRNIQVASAAEEQSLVAEEIHRNVNDINALVIQARSVAGQTVATSRQLARPTEQPKAGFKVELMAKGLVGIQRARSVRFQAFFIEECRSTHHIQERCLNF